MCWGKREKGRKRRRRERERDRKEVCGVIKV
jgi:hypothetical protein